MLVNLHIRDFALIDDIEVDFTKGLNVFTGETGAGKSVILGSISAALGGRVYPDSVREGASFALIELLFHVEMQEVKDELADMDIPIEDDELVISRKIMSGRSICKINSETSTLSRVRKAASYLLDIHSQNEHQSLLDNSKQLAILDEYGKKEISPLKDDVRRLYKQYCEARSELASFNMDETQRLKERTFLEYEIAQIEDANLTQGEDDKLEEDFSRLSQGQKIIEMANEAYMSSALSEYSASYQVDKALKSILSVSGYDKHLDEMAGILSDVEQLLCDFNKELSSFIENADYSEEELDRIQSRLNKINELKSRYGNTIEDIEACARDKKQRLDELNIYDELRERARISVDDAKSELEGGCAALSDARRTCAGYLAREIIKELKGLNFADPKFEITFGKSRTYTPYGTDIIEFEISTNAGEALHPLKRIVSGGELSRVMLAIKTILSGQDRVETLIFDEIDAGISGRTAQLVSEKMSHIGKHRQVICITHLPQIAAMADAHYMVSKASCDTGTITDITLLDEEGRIGELSRLLGGAAITDRVTDNAREMLLLARTKDL